MESSKAMNGSIRHDTKKVEEYPIIVHSMVQVLPRTWPGSNKLGGIAKVTACYYNESMPASQSHRSAGQSTEREASTTTSSGDTDKTKVLTHVDVSYIVVRGKEKMVPLEYCRPAPQYDSNYQALRLNAGMKEIQLRDRSGLLGRCARCGSLRKDCGSCDFVEEQRMQREMEEKMRRAEIENNQNGSDRNENENRNNHRSNVGPTWNRRKRPQNNSTLDAFEYCSTSSSGTASNPYPSTDDFDSDGEGTPRNRVLRNKNRLIINESSTSSSSFSSEDSNFTNSDNSSEDSDGEDIMLVKLRETSKRLKAAQRRALRIARLSKRDHDGELIPTLSKLSGRSKLEHRKICTANDTSTAASSNELNSNRRRRLKPKFSNLSRRIKRLNAKISSGLEQLQHKQQNINNTTSSLSVVENTGKDSAAIQEESISENSAHATIDPEVLKNNSTEFVVNNESHPDQRKVRKRDGNDDSDDQLPEPAFKKSNQINKRTLRAHAVGEKNQLSPTDQSNNHTCKQNIGFVHDSDIGEEEEEEEHVHDGSMEIVQSAGQPFIENQNDSLSGESFDTYNYDYHSTRSDFDDNFIQPEGDFVADELPSDMIDRTDKIPFHELPEFYNEVEKQLRDRKMPLCKTQTKKLQNEFDTNRDKSLKCFSLEKKCNGHRMRLCKILVRDGTDQCRAALKRFGSKKHFRSQQKDGLTKTNWKAQIENLDLRFDKLDEEVESVLRDANLLCKDVRDFNDYYSPRDNEDIGDTFSFDMDESDADTFNYDSKTSKTLTNHVHLHPHAKVVRKRKAIPTSFTNSIKRAKSDKATLKKTNLRSYSTERDVSYVGERLNIGLKVRNKTAIRGKRYVARVKAHGTETTYDMSRDNAYHDLSSRSGLEKKRSHCPSQGKGSTLASAPKRSSQNYMAELDSDTNVQLLTEEIVYDDLLSTHQRQEMDEIEGENITFHASSISAVCDKLSTNYSLEENSHSALLRQLPLLINNPHALDGNSHYVAVSIFETFLKIFQKHGGASLQEMIQMKSKGLTMHLELLVCVFKMLKQNLQSYLKKEDGLTFKVFSISGQSSILEFIVLQILDVLYSQLLPNEWGKPHAVPPRTYKVLKVLCGEIGSIAHLTEVVSKLLYKKFQCQRWQKSSIDNTRWFVSSIDCKYAANFWYGVSNDQPQGSQSRSRLSSFDKAYPRSEIEAIWALFGFFAGSEVTKSETSVRWKLLRSLFSSQTGVLGNLVSPDGKNYPPHIDQIQRCAKEIRYQALLLHKMVPFPDNNSYLVELIQKAVILDVQSHVLRKRWSKSNIITDKINKKDLMLAFKSWHESDYHSRNNCEGCLAKSLLVDYNCDESQELSLFRLTSGSSILESCLQLILAWVPLVPNKKARWKRLQGSFTSLIKSLTAIDESEEAKGGDDFSAIFSTKEGLSMKSIGKREAAAAIIVRLVQSRAKIERQTGSSIDLPIGSMTMKSCQQLWDILSDDRMKHYQSTIIENVPSNFYEHKSDSLDISFIAMKTISILLLQTLNSLQSNQEQHSLVECDCFLFLVSSFLAALASIVEVLHNHNKSEERTPLSYSQEEILRCLNLISCGSLWLSSILCHANSILGNIQRYTPETLSLPLSILAKSVLQRTAPVALECLTCISGTYQGGRSSESCLRLCLSLTRSSTHLALNYHIIKERVFEGINMDSRESVLDNGDKDGENSFAIHRLWNFLMNILDETKPSARFAIAQTTNAMKLTSTGKVLFSRHAGAICATIASLSEYRAKNGLCLDAVFQFMSSRPPPLHSSIDQASLRSDFIYKQQLRQCLGFELTKLMKNKSSCISLNPSNIRLFLSIFIGALLDVDALNTFPTSNYSLMLEIGGNNSVDEEKKLVHKLSRSVNISEFPIIEDVDDEAKGLYQIRDDFLRAPGYYMATRLWSFSDNLGITLKNLSHKNNLNPDSNHLLDIAEALLEDDSDLEQRVREVCAYALGSLPLVSIERQCIKRFMKLRVIYRTLLHPAPCEGEKKNLTNVLLSSVIQAIIQQLDTIATCIDYHEKNKLNSHEYAKACSLQNAFSHLAITTSSWLLKEISLTNSQLDGFGSFLFRYLLLPSLKYGTIDVRKALRENSHIKFDFQPNIINYVDATLFKATNNRIRELVIYSANVDRSKQSTFFEGILDCCLSNTNGFEINFLPALVSKVQNEKNIEDCSCYVKALDLYYSLSSTGSTDLNHIEDTAIKEFRRYAIRKFILRKLGVRDQEKKIAILNHLEQILNSRSLKEQCSNSTNFLITDCDNNGSEYLNFSGDICAILHGLWHCLESTMRCEKLNDSLINKIFRCFCHILYFTTDKGNSILKWCETQMDHNDHAKYFVYEMKVLLHLSKILTSSSKLVADCASLFTREDIITLETKTAPKEVMDFRLAYKVKQQIERTLFPTHSTSSMAKYLYKKSSTKPTRLSIDENLELCKDSIYVKEFITAYDNQS